MTEGNDRIAELSEWAAEVLNEAVELARVPGGGSHQAWGVTGASGGRWFLRTDSAPAGEFAYYTLRREAEIYRTVRSIGLPCPEVLGVHPTLEAVLLERVDGDAAFARLASDAQSDIVADFVPWLARLHGADPDSIEFAELGPATTVRDAVGHELDIWQARLDRSGSSDPFLSACFLWLRDNIPDTGEMRPCLVQGDTGPGNFLHDGRRVTAFLDFELAHFGDPMEDLAWVGTRNAQEPVPDFEHFLTLYGEATGTVPDRARIRYHALFAELRIAVLGAIHPQGASELDAEHGNRLVYGALHRRLTVEALAAAIGVDVPSVALPTPADTDDTRYFDAVLHQMRHQIGPSIVDAYPARLLKGLARVTKYLREVDRAGESHLVAELDDLESLLGFRPASVSEGSTLLLDRVRTRAVSARDLLPYAAAHAGRRTQLLADAMGILATRHLPEL